MLLGRSEWGGRDTWHAWERKVYKVLARKPERKRPLGRPRRGWYDRIRMDLREISWGSVGWIQLVQKRGRWPASVNTAMNLWVLAPRSFFSFRKNSWNVYHKGNLWVSKHWSADEYMRRKVQEVGRGSRSLTVRSCRSRTVCSLYNDAVSTLGQHTVARDAFYNCCSLTD
jgi:hypothetical protein